MLLETKFLPAFSLPAVFMCPKGIFYCADWQTKNRPTLLYVIELPFLLHSRYRTLFPFKPAPMPNLFRHTFMSKIQYLGLLRVSEVLKGLRSKKEKMTTTPSFFGQKIKWRVNIWKTNGIFVVQFTRKNIFFPITYQKSLQQ